MIYSLDFDRYIVSGSGDNTVRLWDILDGKHIYSLSTSDDVTCVAISPDGCYAAASSLNKNVYVWGIATGYMGESLGNPDGHKDSVYSVAFAPNGRDLVSGSLDKTVKLWGLNAPRPGSKVEDGKCVRTLEGHKVNTRLFPRLFLFSAAASDFVLCVCVTPDGHWVMSGSKDRGVQFWDPIIGNA
jgi:general transcriptional corepressor TUP1